MTEFPQTSDTFWCASQSQLSLMILGPQVSEGARRLYDYEALSMHERLDFKSYSRRKN
ncbi:hypothetical protein GCM10008090_33270 [Arenicella chitinivorans]|uniref:Uncharacterized protein n=1 Tax=Arenicella chitinivorans TaxID=1329800 RepID=A0A918S1S5_9GAMM|nr:hypothetical protein GCM10008090_33270 [Arenicella chitinivorans]